MLTEKEVSRSWSRLFSSREFESGALDRAEQLLDELRPESPLRHRLTLELDELRSRHTERMSVGSQTS